MNRLLKFCLTLLALCLSTAALAQADLEVNTPGVAALKQSMQARHAQLAGLYASGAVGLTADGLVAVHDASAVPLAQRQAVNSLVAAENQDRTSLYAEIARANGHPEWQTEIRSTFAQRWIQRAQAGWWVQSGGTWSKK
ncbi:YdbL family protein [Ferriphaselus sp. R-1]|uniref:YdbL family protein n=1 Tax=Ferriphaselus sp. R-1 TaxID=1485544 RepID=UPI000555AFF1|nr:YdbL family protein [Ferriphaselus sp. R-1]